MSSAMQGFVEWWNLKSLELKLVVADKDAEVKGPLFRALEGVSEQAWQAAQPKWQPIETAPKTFDPVLLLYYENKKPVIVIAHWVAEFSEESTEDFAVYNEETDEYYCPEGWYEQQRFNEEYGYILMDIEPRYWMPLPQSPTDE